MKLDRLMTPEEALEKYKKSEEWKAGMKDFGLFIGNFSISVLSLPTILMGLGFIGIGSLVKTISKKEVGSEMVDWAVKVFALGSLPFKELIESNKYRKKFRETLGELKNRADTQTLRQFCTGKNHVILEWYRFDQEVRKIENKAKEPAATDEDKGLAKGARELCNIGRDYSIATLTNPWRWIAQGSNLDRELSIEDKIRSCDQMKNVLIDRLKELDSGKKLTKLSDDRQKAVERILPSTRNPQKDSASSIDKNTIYAKLPGKKGWQKITINDGTGVVNKVISRSPNSLRQYGTSNGIDHTRN